MPAELLVIGYDPGEEPGDEPVPVIVSIDVPPRATSKGWGDMAWLAAQKRRRGL